MKRLGILTVLGLFVFSTVAFAYSSGPIYMGGNIGETVILMEMKAREERFRQQCYFTSQGAICPTLTPTPSRILMRQKIHLITATPGKASEEPERVIIHEVRAPARGISQVKVVMSISGKPGSFSRWGKKRNVRNICYFSSEATAKGNLVCPSFFSDIGKNPQSFRASILYRPSLARLGKEEIVDLNPERVDQGHSLEGYNLR